MNPDDTHGPEAGAPSTRPGLTRERPEIPSSYSEAAFRKEFIDRSLTRARITTLVVFTLLLWIALIGVLGNIDTGIETLTAIRLGIVLPGICTVLAACYVPRLKPFYTPIVAFGISFAALGVIFAGVWSSHYGTSFVKLTSVLAIVHSTLVVGLRTSVSALVAAVLILGYLVLAIAYQTPVNEIVYSTSILIATAIICVLSANSLERLLRESFVEKLRLAAEAERDGLTGVYNRRKFDSLTEQLWQQAYRDDQHLQVLIVDIDRFKYYNDLYGHQAGDACMRRVARIIADAAHRPFDFCARYGGEEFALVFYGITPENSPALIADELREQVIAASIPHEHSEVAKIVTVSIGSSIGNPRSGRSLARLIQTADEALYEAKLSGRNRTVHRRLESSETDTGNFCVQPAQ